MGVRVGKHIPHSLNEAALVDVIAEDQPPLDTTDNDMVEHTFRVETGMTGHDR